MQPLQEALAGLRPLLLDLDGLVRAVAGGRRRSERPEYPRVRLRPVDLKSGRRLQIVADAEHAPLTSNHEPGAAAEAAVDALLAQPFGNWHVETRERVVQLRVTKRGEAAVHERPVTGMAAAATHDRPPQHLLDPADPLFAALGAGADKRRQVDAFLRQLAVVAPAALAAAAARGGPLRVVDLGCGNAYLTFAAHRWLAAEAAAAGVAVSTTGVDVRADMVDRNGELASTLGLAGLDFVASDIDGAALAQPGPVDVVLALHACDTATDDALARAVAWDAPAVLAAPCCHHDLQRQLAGRPRGSTPLAALTRDAILAERFADVLTDALRAQLLRLVGYRVAVVEFVASRHTPRNVLLRATAAEGGGAPAVPGGGRPATPSAADVTQYRELVDAWQVTPALARRLASRLDMLPA